jgi:hypothetical protein
MTHSEIVSPCIARDARAICREQGIIGIGDRRDRTPTEQELALLTKYFGSQDKRARLPMTDLRSRLRTPAARRALCSLPNRTRDNCVASLPQPER